MVTITPAIILRVILGVRRGHPRTARVGVRMGMGGGWWWWCCPPLVVVRRATWDGAHPTHSTGNAVPLLLLLLPLVVCRLVCLVVSGLMLMREWVAIVKALPLYQRVNWRLRPARAGVAIPHRAAVVVDAPRIALSIIPSYTTMVWDGRGTIVRDASHGGPMVLPTIGGLRLLRRNGMRYNYWMPIAPCLRTTVTILAVTVARVDGGLLNDMIILAMRQCAGLLLLRGVCGVALAIPVIITRTLHCGPQQELLLGESVPILHACRVGRLGCHRT